LKETETVRSEIVPLKKTVSKQCLFGTEWFTLSWTAGLLAAFLHYTLAGAAVILLVGGVLLYLRRRTELLCMLLGICLGMTCWTVYDLRVRQPLTAMSGECIVCEGEVKDVRRLANDRACYLLSAKLHGISASAEWYAEANIPELQVGDMVTLEAELSCIPRDYRFDTAAYLAGKGQYLRIYQAEMLDYQKHSGFSLRRIVRDYREKMTEKICSEMAGEEAGLFCAMLFGDKSMMSSDTTEALYQAGIGHITAVSGLHLVLFCMALGQLFRLLQLSGKMQFLLLIPSVMLFIFFVDSSVSVYRAACMLCISRSASLFGRKGDTLRSLCITMFLCTVFTPYVIGSVSFWLSVSGVFGIGVLAPYLVQRTRWSGLRANLLELFSVSLAVFPASVLLCGESSLAAPLSNWLIMIFAITALYTGFAFLLSGGLLVFLLPFGEWLCRLTAVWAKAIAGLPFSHIVVSSAVIRWAVVLLTVLFLAALAWQVSPRRFAAMLLGGMLILCAVGITEDIRNESEMRVAVLGRKQKSVVVVTADDCTLAVDLSGDVRNPQYLRKYLSDYGMRRVDVLICEAKNAAAYQAELEGIEVDEVILPQTAKWRNDGKVCGTDPLFPDRQAFDIALNELQCAVDSEKTLFSVSWHGVSVIACPSDDEKQYSANAVIRFGGFPDAADDCDIMICPREDADQNVLLRLRADGACKIQSLLQ